MKTAVEEGKKDQFTHRERSGDLPSSPMAGNEKNIHIVDGSEGEAVSVKARKRKVTERLSSLGMNVRENCDPPVIAVLGSGGGLRAMVGFLGTITKLAELNLLGAITYIAGISGSTWCMSSLYSLANRSNWSDFSCMEDVEYWLCERIKSETEREWTGPWKKIKERFLGDSYSLTDLWAYTFVFSVINSVDDGKLSSHKEKCETGEDPYPIYSAVRRTKIRKNSSEAWFEFTPHKSGFPAHQSYVKTEHLGCMFKGGRLMKVQPEYDLIYLQGLWGSAPGADWVKLCFREIYRKLIKVMTRVKDRTVSFFKRAWNWISGKAGKEEEISQARAEVLGGAWNWISGKAGKEEEISPARAEVLGGPVLQMLMKTKTKAPEPPKSWSEHIQDVFDNGKVMKNIASCLTRWKWGTTNNFLYKCKHKISEACDLFHKERIHLVDAGLEINTPYPLVLPPHRKVDLILSFDFSQGDPFETVKRTAKYCKEHQIPFPENTEESYENPPTKGCYIFEGDGNETPDVMHFPLFNTQTCGDAEKIVALSKKYATRVHSYDDAMMNELLDITKKNVESGLDQIRDKIQQCVWRCNKRGVVTDVTGEDE